MHNPLWTETLEQMDGDNQHYSILKKLDVRIVGAITIVLLFLIALQIADHRQVNAGLKQIEQTQQQLNK